MLSSKIPLLSAHEIIKILAHFGFKPLRQTGSPIHFGKRTKVNNIRIFYEPARSTGFPGQ
jgi:predicted RNA binding protein YcfA (HicA-like mRNA interferase family)